MERTRRVVTLLPRQPAHQQSGLDVRADVYGVAAVTYLLLSGQRPFPDSRTVSDVALRDPAVVPEPVRAGPPAVDDLLRAALAHDPARRPATARGLADQLRALQAEASDEHTPVGT